MAIEVAVGALAVILFAVTYWMFWAGMFGTAGVVALRRCAGCGRLVPTTHQHVGACPVCRHMSVGRRLPHHRLQHYFESER